MLELVKVEDPDSEGGLTFDLSRKQNSKNQNCRWKISFRICLN